MPSIQPLRQLARNRMMIKILGTTLLTLLLLFPLASIEDSVEERSQRRQEVSKQLAQQWGPAATLRGPLLVIPTRGTNQYHYLIPEDLTVSGNIPVTERYRGIFRLPCYRGHLDLSGRFAIPKIKRAAPSRIPGADLDEEEAPDALMTMEDPNDLLWEEASWVMLVGPGKSPPVQMSLTHAKNPVSLQTSADAFGIPGTTLHTPIPAHRDAGGVVTFRAVVDLLGSESLDIAPLSRETHMDLTSNWPHPSFDGDRLPNERTVDAGGFRASWELNAALLGPIPSYLGGSLPTPMMQSPRVSIRFIDAISHYQQVTRGVKYALLVILLTFVTFFLFEILSKLNIHPIQYLLVGCALTLFYLLLLSLSEHLSFSWSYLIAASAVVLLIALYARALLAHSGRAAAFGGGLGVVYGLLFVILREESLALLAGSWALFALLALVMFLTRRLDWATLEHLDNE